MATWTRGRGALERRDRPEWYLWQDGAVVVMGAVSMLELERVQPGEPDGQGRWGCRLEGGGREQV